MLSLPYLYLFNIENNFSNWFLRNNFLWIRGIQGRINAKIEKINYTEVSAINRMNVIEPFDILIKSVIGKIESGEIKEEDFITMGIKPKKEIPERNLGETNESWC